MVGDGVGVAEGVEVDVCVTRLVAVGVDDATGVSVGTNVALGVGVGVEATTTVGVDVGTSVAVGCNVGIGVAVAIATGVGDGKTMVGEDGDVAINIGVGVLRSLTQPAISIVATIPETTTTATRDNPDVTPASSRRTCSQPLQQSLATSRAA